MIWCSIASRTPSFISQVHSDFANKLSNITGETAIIDFNFDTLLEEALLNNTKINVKYLGKSMQFVNNLPGATKNIALLKPHGSCNFLVCKNCDHNSGKSLLFMARGLDPMKLRSGRCDDRKNCPKCGKRVENEDYFLVPYADTRYNLKFREIHKELTKEMETIIKNSREIISIGYSFYSPRKGKMLDKDIQGPLRKRKIIIIGRDFRDAQCISNTAINAGIKGVPDNSSGFGDYVKRL